MSTIAEIKAQINERVRAQKSHILSDGVADILDEMVDSLVARVGPTPPVLIDQSVVDQTGTDNVFATQLNSNFTSGLEWARAGVGQYTATLTGEMVGTFANPTFILVGSLQGTGSVKAYKFSNDVMKVDTYNLAGAATDGLLVNTAIEIRIYAALN